MKTFALAIGLTICLLPVCVATLAFGGWLLPFLPLAVVVLATHALPRERARTRRALRLASVFVLLSLIGAWLLSRLRFLEDGPFHGLPYRGDLGTLVASESVPYRGGALIVYNRTDEEAPIFAFEKAGSVRWAIEMDVTANPDYASDHLSRMENLSVHPHVLFDQVRFRGHWSFGAEGGWAYIWKFDGFDRFFLSW